jgi:hypothetical protein
LLRKHVIKVGYGLRHEDDDDTGFAGIEIALDHRQMRNRAGDPATPRSHDMIQLMQMPLANVIGIKISGKMEKTDIEQVAKVIEDKLIVHDKVNISEIESFNGISFEALVADIKFALPHLRDFDQQAIVSEKRWIERLVAIGDKLFPSVEARHFSFDQKDAALRWVQASQASREK